MISLAMWLAILALCCGLGAAVMSRLRVRTSGLAEELPFAAAIGLGVLAYLVLAVGLLGSLHLWTGLALLALLALLGGRHLVRLARGLPAFFAEVSPRTAGAVALCAFLLLMFALTALGALAPSSDNDYDSLVYHLTIPKLYLQDGRIHLIPWLTHSDFPFTMEMLYTLGLLLRDQSLAKLFHFGAGWLTVLAIFAFGRRWWNDSAGRLGALIFAAVPLVAWQMMTAYIELGLALYAFLAVFALARWFDGRSRGEGPGWLWISALLCGWALGVKMLGGAVLIFALLALLWGLRTTSDRPRSLRRIVILAVIAIAIASPWYLKSYIWTGNPVYPFFYNLFDGRYWTAERARLYTEAQHAFGLGTGPLQFLALPWNLTMRSRWFFDQPDVIRPFNVYVLSFGPLFLALLPALLIAGPVRGAGRLCLWFALLFTALWFALTQNGRYLIPILPGLAACSGLAAARLFERRGLPAAAAGIALAFGLLIGLYPTLLLAAPAARVSLGLESKTAYLTRVSQTYRTFTAVEEATPPDAEILILAAEPRTFYLNRHYLLGNHAEIFSPADLSGSPALMDTLRRMGVTYILMGPETMHDMTVRAGHLETLLGDLAAAHRIIPVGTYGNLTLWRVVEGEKAHA